MTDTAQPPPQPAQMPVDYVVLLTQFAGQVADQVAQKVAQQSADQVGQQVAQATAQAARQAVAEASRQVIDATRTAASQEVGAERESETGTDDLFKAASQANALNLKRTYDEYQHESLESIRRNRTVVDRMAGLSVDHDGQVRNIAIQALQNAVETANLVGKNAATNVDSLQKQHTHHRDITMVNTDNVQKQHTAHRDIATDNLWNPVQQGAADAVTLRAVTIDDASLKAIGAIVAAALAERTATPQA